ncbi:hypothetical protein MLD38_008988 [Melastoma candidum]|uniref:Uncharacterized protein n=1 Tax=Melastoma candidum TaxID=119954 RepID=A0ACB9RW27_9MYRT|nr:hypothetical protein MLD38_008988 [Melastoma candidum]
MVLLVAVDRKFDIHGATLGTVYLLEPAPLALILTAISVTFGSALRALNYGKEMERNRDFSEASITLDKSQALMIPIMSSCSLLLMFYLSHRSLSYLLPSLL